MKEFNRSTKSSSRPAQHDTSTTQRKSSGLPGNAKDSLIPKSLEEQAKSKSTVSKSSNSNSKMPATIQAKMEDSFGTDFSNVNIHQGDSATQMNALAYTQGNDIHFAPGQ